MSFSLFEADNNNYCPEIITPEGDENKEDDCYSCTECSSNIEILDLNEENNILSFKCPKDGNIKMPLKDYLEEMPKNTYLYSKCNFCNRQQNKIKNDSIFKFCLNCKTIICNNCIIKHDKNHLFIYINKLLTKCLLHPKNDNKSFCFECNIHLCEECLKERKHMMHKKINFLEITPSNEEINTLLKIISEYKNHIFKSKNDSTNKLKELEKNFNKNKEKLKEEYNILNSETKINLEIEKKNNNKNCDNEVNEIKKKWEKEGQLIKDKYIEIEKKNNNKYNEKLEILEKNYKNEINEEINIFNKEIEKYNELLKFNEIIYNTYDKYKSNYYHNKNLINLLIIHDKNENNILKEIKNNEKFIEAKHQKITQIKKFKIKDLNIEKENNIMIDNFEELEEDYPMGLDIGYNYCRISVYRNGGVEMIPNKNGEINIPSIITILSEDKILLGEEALDYLETNYEDSIYGIQRYIGREYIDVYEEIRKYENFPFKIIEDKNNKKLLISINKKKK